MFYDQPRTLVRRVSVQELEAILGRDAEEHDSELATQLNGMVLTERLSSSKLASWLRQAPGKQSREALTVLADASVFLNPPADEISVMLPVAFRYLKMQFNLDFSGFFLSRLDILGLQFV